MNIILSLTIQFSIHSETLITPFPTPQTSAIQSFLAQKDLMVVYKSVSDYVDMISTYY